MGIYPANGYGLYDMGGNTREWCQDWWDENYYSSSPVNNPQGPETGTYRVVRGGDWTTPADYLLLAQRDNGGIPSDGRILIGFRCVSDVDASSDSFTINEIKEVLDLADTSVSQVTLETKLTELPASLKATSEVTITLYNPEDNLVKGEVVNLTVDKGTIQTPATDNGDGTYTATYTASDVPGEATVTVVTNSGKLATITIELLELVLSPSKSSIELVDGAAFQTGESASILVTLKTSEALPLASRQVTLHVEPVDNLELISTVVTDQEGKSSFQFTSSQPGVRVITASVDEIKLDASVAVIFSGEAIKPEPQKLTGDVNGDGTVNIFDLVIAAGSFGKTGDGIMGDVNGDGGVNIFDLVIVAGNFGKSLTAAPSMVAKIELTTEQKHHIGLAIDQLESNSNRSNAEEIALNVLKAILPERLPTRTQLLANYPNPFNPETWIPFQLAEDSTVTARIYDVTGKQIRIIELGHIAAGNYVESSKAIYWDGRTEDGEFVSSGTYFYQIEAGDYTETRKMIILK